MLSRAQGFLERASQAAVTGGEATGGLAVDIRSPYVPFTYHASCALGLPLIQYGLNLKQGVNGLKIFENH